ncbi:MAG: DUF3416 domain-containing protein, partial [Bifidobacteriaceae bacterium]|nr:DUF3416 domain-containing protein [Bifidobacteriaceae bacterium]
MSQPAPPRPPAKQPRPAPRVGVGRIPIVDVGPVREGGRWPAKAVAGEAVPVSATVFKEGHDAVGAAAVLVSPAGKALPAVPLAQTNRGLARWEGCVVPDAPGDWRFRVEAWADPYATWTAYAAIKIPEGQDVELVLEEGAVLMDRAAKRVGLTRADAAVFREAAATLRDTRRSPAERLAQAAGGEAARLLRERPLRDFLTRSAEYPLRVERERALVGNWYELFPRSVGCHFSAGDGWVSGTLRTCADGAGRVAAMGFDVLYLTPVHPIGTTFRKGRNNSLTAYPGDPGSPYAIGSAAGGHD